MASSAPELTGWRARGTAFGLGAVAACGQAPLGFWWLALPAFAAIIALVARAPDMRRAAGLAWWAGAGHFALALSWIVEPFLIDIGRHGWMAPFALVLMAGGLALFWALAGAVSVGFRWRALGFAVALAAAEYARSQVFTGFPWALPGHIWIGAAPGQGAAFAGAHGLTLATLLVAVLPVVWGWRGAVAVVGVVAAAWWGGTARLSLPLPARADAPLIRLVQPNTDQAGKWDRTRARAIMDTQLAMTAAAPPVELVIWPETSIPYLLDGAPDIPLALAGAGQGAPVLAGVQRTDGTARFWNSLIVAAPDGQVAASYDKHHLVPFGEYLPLGDLVYAWTGLGAFATVEGYGYSTGPGPAVLDLGPRLGRAIPLICYEAVFPEIPRHAPGPRADWMVQITNDAWFGVLTGPFQHFALARLRAVEMGLPLVRVANTGVTGVIDARGMVTAALPFGTRGTLDAALPPALPPTPYARFGDTPVLMLLAGLFLLARPRRPLDRNVTQA